MTQLVLLPGLACDAAMWQHQLDVLPAHHQTRVTDVHTRHGTIQAMAQALLDELPGDLILCGASMGGIVAMEAIRQAPQRIKGLALLGTNARPETDDVRKLRQLAVTLFESGRAAEVLRANVALAFHASRRSDAVLVRTYLDFVLQSGVRQLVDQNRPPKRSECSTTGMVAAVCTVISPVL